MKLNLQLFTGHSVTVYSDSGFSAASASPNSSVDKNTTVTLTLTLASGYELKDIEVVSGGVTIVYGDDSITFAMGEADVVLNAISQKSTLYKVVENCKYSVNGTGGEVVRNMTLKKGKNGQIVDVTCTPTDMASMNVDILANMVAGGVVEKV